MLGMPDWKILSPYFRELTKAIERRSIPDVKSVIHQIFVHITVTGVSNNFNVSVVCCTAMRFTVAFSQHSVITGNVLITDQQWLEEITKHVLSMEATEHLLVQQVVDALQLANHRTTPSEKRVIAIVKGILSQEFASEFHLNYVAAQVHLTPSYLSRLFKKETGVTLEQYLTEVRMENAKTLLTQHIGLKAYQIGEMVGYSDPGYFCRLFKRRVGVTPKEYANLSS